MCIRDSSEGIEKARAGGGRFGFVPGAVLGLLPQCGFSAMAANLYASKVVTLGTLLAVFPVSYTHLDVYKRQALYSKQTLRIRSLPLHWWRCRRRAVWI